MTMTLVQLPAHVPRLQVACGELSSSSSLLLRWPNFRAGLAFKRPSTSSRSNDLRRKTALKKSASRRLSCKGRQEGSSGALWSISGRTQLGNQLHPHDHRVSDGTGGCVPAKVIYGGTGNCEVVSKVGWGNAGRAEASTERAPHVRQGKLTPRRNSTVGAGAGIQGYNSYAGVAIDGNSELVMRRMAALAENPGIGGFGTGGHIPFGDSYLVGATDGVGTKLKLAFKLDAHEKIGHDLARIVAPSGGRIVDLIKSSLHWVYMVQVALSVNEIITSGARPLLFVDYIAASHLDVDQAEQVIKGIVNGCNQADCVLLGGETAEMPDFYAEREYDLSGFAVGTVKKGALIDGTSIKVGDQIVGLASSGPHSNGFSLVLRVLKKSGASLKDPLPGAAEGVSIGEALLAPTVIYVKQVLEMIAKGGVNGIGHITGGGLTESIPRIFLPGLGAFVKVNSWTVPPIFKWLQQAGCVEEADMFRTFNMGIGMFLVVSPERARDILGTYSNTTLLGHVVEGEGVTYSDAWSVVGQETDTACHDREMRAQKKQVKKESKNHRASPRLGAGVGLTYKDAGVDINAGSELVRRIAALAPGIGGFGGLLPFGESYLVAGADGVGTKLKLAFKLDVHNTVGVDLVAMSLKDIVTSGAKPLFFLFYFATSYLSAHQVEQVMKGIADGCCQADYVLLGGKTAEIPDFYAEGEYDLSGFVVGSVKKDALIDGTSIKVGDQIIGLASSGPHSNGFSLVHRVLEKSGASLEDSLPGAEEGISIREALFSPTVIYVKQVLELVGLEGVKGIAHITGGGFTDNIPRIFPAGLGAFVNVDAWNVPPIFKWLQMAGGIQNAEIFRTFNMGIGMILVVSPERANDIVSMYTNTFLLGRVVEGEGVSYGNDLEESFINLDCSYDDKDQLYNT